MENIETNKNIFTLTDKNEANESNDIEEDASALEEIEVDEDWQLKAHASNGKKEKESSGLTKTNLEILLSQNDVLPLLKKINKETRRGEENISLQKFINSKDTKKNDKSTALNRNSRISNKNFESDPNDVDEVNSDDDNEYIKLEEQPENLRNGKLKEYQMEALNWLLRLHNMKINGILADEMGLGKTIQTISLLAYLHLQNANYVHLVIVPKVTIKNWQREISKWLPDVRILFFYGNKEERKVLIEKLKKRDYNIVLTTFECAMIERSALTKINYEYLIIDEAHRLKNEKAKFSYVVRQFNSEHRLLLTGTPLQNNLHELWALLNFLMPKIFNDSEEFDKIFNLDTANPEDQIKIVKQIHHLLRPFVLRRLKSEVEFKLPPKKEIYLYVGLSELQKEMYRKILTKNIDVVNGVNKDKIQLLNILMQLKKVCNHPYLFPNVEKGPPYIEGEHLIYNAMKLKILDVLLKKLKQEGDKVLIFSQMTTLLNILDDYCRYRGFEYCRIDGSTSTEDRDARIEDFQNPNSDKFVFLLSTRAGGLGINLHQANVVIIYDSDWNPQVDLQAIDRAHRIGQTRPVTVYRFVTEGTIEEKIIERAAKKLKIDHLIIQRGKQVQNKISAIEMTNILQHGVDKIFSSSEESCNRNIEEILAYSINKTEKINSNLKDLEEKFSINNLSLSSDKGDIYKFEGEDYKKKSNIAEDNLIRHDLLSIAIGQRERKLINGNIEEKNKNYKKPKLPTGWRAKAGGGYIHQFYDHETLDYLDEKENLWKEFLSKKEEGIEVDTNEIPEEFTKEDEDYRSELIKAGYMKWTKKDFSKFLRACEVWGLNDYEGISKMMKTKTPQEVQEYSEVFKRRIDDFPNGQRMIARINKFEMEKNKIVEYQNVLDEIYTEISVTTDDIYGSLEIPFRIIKGKSMNNSLDEEEDKYFMCLMFKYGYRNWNCIRNHILFDPFMKFNLSMKLKSDQELLERANFLIGCFKTNRNKSKPKRKASSLKKVNGRNSRTKKKGKKMRRIK